MVEASYTAYYTSGFRPTVGTYPMALSYNEPIRLTFDDPNKGEIDIKLFGAVHDDEEGYFMSIETNRCLLSQDNTFTDMTTW